MTTLKIEAQELQSLAQELLVASGAAADEALLVAESLVWADLRGRHPQGVFRIPVLADMMSKGLISSPATMRWDQPAPAVHHLDAGNGFGQVAGRRAMLRAVELARQSGIGLVTVSGTNHYGAASYFCALAAEEGCLGLTCTNATPKVAPWGGTRAVLGTNPIALGCPSASGGPILVDLSTAAIAGSTIRAINETGGQLPPGVALDAEGRPTTDPRALNTGSLLPAAGPKGFGLGLMVEVLSGILAGAGMSHEVGPYYQTGKRGANLGHVFAAVDIGRLQPLEAYLRRVEDLHRAIMDSPRLDEGEEIRIPGETRWRCAERYSREGISLPEETVGALEKTARRTGRALPWVVSPAGQSS
jgi:ureidoglycolate dehydrogenase (NAD+)